MSGVPPPTRATRSSRPEGHLPQVDECPGHRGTPVDKTGRYRGGRYYSPDLSLVSRKDYPCRGCTYVSARTHKVMESVCTSFPIPCVIHKSRWEWSTVYRALYESVFTGASKSSGGTLHRRSRSNGGSFLEVLDPNGDSMGRLSIPFVPF